MENKSLIENSMNILIKSGEARNLIKDSYNFMAEFDFNSAEEKLKEAKSYILEAHKIQTAEIQKEASGEEPQYSVLFSHAQDTMMTINSELITSRKMLLIFKEINKRLEKLEELND